MSELDVLDPVPETVKLVSGATVVLENLRARQFFKLLRILTHGAFPLVSDGSIFKLNPDDDPSVFGARLLSVVCLAIPDAEDETIQFLRSMVKPYGLIERRGLNKQDTERNNELWASLDAELANPELDDLVTLLEAIVRREATDIQALGKRLMSMFRLAQKTGQAPSIDSNPPSLTSPDANSSADSPEPSTSSPPSTDGTTNPSSLSPSAASGNASQPSASGSSTAPGSDSNG